MKIKFLCVLIILLFSSNSFSQGGFDYSQKAQLTQSFESGKLQFGIGVNLKLDLVQNSFGYFRLSLTGGAGVPFGESFGLKRNNFIFYYFSEIDIFRGGLGASSLSYTNQNFKVELRNSFLLSGGSTKHSINCNYIRPVIHFVSNSSHPIFDPFSWSITLGTTFVNGLNEKVAQRVGIGTIGYRSGAFTYLNDGPPFHYKFLGIGDGYDRWWTGSGMIGFYNPWRNALVKAMELKYDKFTGLQHYAYELSTALKLKHIPYKSKEIQLYNRQRFELGILTNFNLGYNFSVYDMPLIDIQHGIHFKRRYSFHNTPLKWRMASGFNYNKTFLVQ